MNPNKTIQNSQKQRPKCRDICDAMEKHAFHDAFLDLPKRCLEQYKIIFKRIFSNAKNRKSPERQNQDHDFESHQGSPTARTNTQQNPHGLGLAQLVPEDWPVKMAGS